MARERRFSLVSIVSDVLAGTQFLSRIPMHHFNMHRFKLGVLESFDSPPDFARTAYAFPLAGLIIALPAALIIWILGYSSLSTSAIAVLATGALILTTGALHEDGLADVADGFWGGHDRVKKLTIMRDSSIGTYGTLTLILSVGLRIILLASLLTQYSLHATALLVLATSSLSRGAMLWPWLSLLPARPSTGSKTEGDKDPSSLSARFGSPGDDTMLPALLCSIPALLIFITVCGAFSTSAALLLSALSVYCVTNLARHHIGGHTGDVLGATQQMSELGLLIGLAATI